MRNARLLIALVAVSACLGACGDMSFSLAPPAEEVRAMGLDSSIQLKGRQALQAYFPADVKATVLEFRAKPTAVPTSFTFTARIIYNGLAGHSQAVVTGSYNSDTQRIQLDRVQLRPSELTGVQKTIIRELEARHHEAVSNLLVEETENPQILSFRCLVGNGPFKTPRVGTYNTETQQVVERIAL